MVILLSKEILYAENLLIVKGKRNYLLMSIKLKYYGKGVSAGIDFIRLLIDDR
jgi:hypothetical protein